MRAFDPRRFGEWSRGEYRLVKGREDYSLRHEIPFPHYDRPAGRPVRVSPLHDEMRRRGAVMEQAVGWERPAWFAPKGSRRRIFIRFAARSCIGLRGMSAGRCARAARWRI